MAADLRVKGSTGLLGLIGNPVVHTLSPQLHNTLSRLLGNDYIYLPMRVLPESLGDAVKGLKALNFSGFNVTIPHKSAVIGMLDDVSFEAKMIGAVNTVRIDGGKLYGYNTDSEGFAASFRDMTGMGFAGMKIAVLGAGGTARTAAVRVVLEEAGSVTILNRTADRARELSFELREKAGSLKTSTNPDCIRWEALDSRDAAAVLYEADIIINTTSAGMYPDINSSPLPSGFRGFTPKQIVYDLIYNPGETLLLKMARNSGCMAVNGLGMLFLQGVRAYEIWTGTDIPADIKDMAFEIFSRIL